MSLRQLQAEPFSVAARKIRIGCGTRCCHGHCRQAIPHCSSENAASIPKSEPEIKNRCTQEGLNGEKPTSIRKSELEIKNRCTKQPIFSTFPQHIPSTSPAHPTARVPSRVDDAPRRRSFASTLVRQWRRKRVLMRPEAAFPYVFAAQGAQHPPKKPPRSMSPPCSTRPTRLHANSFCRISSHRRWCHTACAYQQAAR